MKCQKKIIFYGNKISPLKLFFFFFGTKGKFLVFPSIARNVQHPIGLNAKTLNKSIVLIMGIFAIAWEIFHERYFQLSKSHHKKFEFQGKKI